MVLFMRLGGFLASFFTCNKNLQVAFLLHLRFFHSCTSGIFGNIQSLISKCSYYKISSTSIRDYFLVTLTILLIVPTPLCRFLIMNCVCFKAANKWHPVSRVGGGSIYELGISACYTMAMS